MAEELQIPKPFFIDIETVAQYRLITDAPDWMQKAFLKHFAYEFTKLNQETPLHPEGPKRHLDFNAQGLWDKKAGTTAEFGKIICISIGKFILDEGLPILKVKTLFDTNEQKLLIQFRDILNGVKDPNSLWLCAHNGKEFDFPFLFRRMIVNRVIPPSVLNVMNIKQWEWRLYDTMDMWSGTQWKHKASLNLLCELFGVDSPKGDMDGSMVGQVFYDAINQRKDESDQEHQQRFNQLIKKIIDYCGGDILALANLFCRLTGFNTITEKDVRYA